MDGRDRDDKVNGKALACYETGQREPVAFVRGAISDLNAWEAQVLEIGRSHRAISDSPNFQWSNEPIDADAADPWPAPRR